MKRRAELDRLAKGGGLIDPELQESARLIFGVRLRVYK